MAASTPSLQTQSESIFCCCRAALRLEPHGSPFNPIASRVRTGGDNSQVRVGLHTTHTQSPRGLGEEWGSEARGCRSDGVWRLYGRRTWAPGGEPKLGQSEEGGEAQPEHWDRLQPESASSTLSPGAWASRWAGSLGHVLLWLCLESSGSQTSWA